MSLQKTRTQYNTPFERFVNSLNSEITVKDYTKCINYFLKYCQLTDYNQLLSSEEFMDDNKKSDMISDYLVYLRKERKLSSSYINSIQDFGYLLHPKTGEYVTELTDYQYRIWKNENKAKYRVVIKSQKVGISTSALLEDFQIALTKAKGFDILIIAQTQAHANEHLRTLKNLILNSDKYRQFLITNPSELLLRERRLKLE